MNIAVVALNIAVVALNIAVVALNAVNTVEGTILLSQPWYCP